MGVDGARQRQVVTDLELADIQWGHAAEQVHQRRQVLGHVIVEIWVEGLEDAPKLPPGSAPAITGAKS